MTLRIVDNRNQDQMKEREIYLENRVKELQERWASDGSTIDTLNETIRTLERENSCLHEIIESINVGHPAPDPAVAMIGGGVYGA